MAPRNKADENEETEGEERADKPQRKRSSSMLMIWLEDAWEGWLKSMGGVILLGIAYMLYKFDVVGEGLAGVALVLAVIFGALGSVVLPALPLIKSQLQKALAVTAVAVAVVASVWPALRAAMPAKPLGEVHLTSAQPSANLHVDGNGPYELAVGGAFKTSGGEAEATYTLKVTGQGSDEVSGSIKREMVSVRGRRGSSGALVEHTVNMHRVDVRGSELSISADAVDDQLADGLFISVRPAGPSPMLFIILGTLAFLLALALDSQLVEPKGKLKGYFAVGVGIAVVFALYYAYSEERATPQSLVRPAITAFIVGMAAGGLSGWVLGALARMMFGPKLKKAKR